MGFDGWKDLGSPIDLDLGTFHFLTVHRNYGVALGYLKEQFQKIAIKSIDEITSDQIRTAYFLITGKSTRKNKLEIMQELNEIFKNNIEE